MRLRGTTGGMSLLLEPADTAENLAPTLGERAGLLAERVEIELGGPVNAEALEAVLGAVRVAGGTVTGVRPSREPGPPPIARTEIITKTLRGGTRREVGGSVIVLGDVNAGVELIAGGDVIVVGTLRGLAHAGAAGRTDAIIWASRIAAPQVRIANALARAPEGSSLAGMRVQGSDGPEIARLENGQIVIEPGG